MHKKGYSFGTFRGVFMPSVLTILGVVMYLRFGWVLGNVGLAGTLLIVTMSCAVTFVTGLSLAALATNMHVGGGGAYYILSRSLGVEAGASVGVPLYLAQSFGIAFYIAGFSESLCEVFPVLDPVMVGVITLISLALLAFISADVALKVQFIVLLCIVVSLVSFVAGSDAPAGDVVQYATPPRVAFWAVFAVFFPAVTGIEAGIAMSGDLKDPARSLPRGTLTAVITGFVIYLIIPIVLYHRVSDPQMLIHDPLVMQRVARWEHTILVGVWAASLSSAVGALLGAPRTLQALARDRVLPRVIGRGFGRGGDPYIAAAITFVIALCGVVFGNLNAIAPLLSMFFLTSYGLLNLSAGMEELMGHPAWRPRFRIPAWVGLLGFVGCTCAMFMINAIATVLAAAVAAGLYWWMKRRRLRARWGDMRLGMLMYGVREMLYRLAGTAVEPRNWAPNLLVFSGPPSQRWYLVELADALSRRSGFMTVASLVRTDSWTTERSKAISEAMRSYLKKRNIRALVRVAAVDEPLVGACEFVRSYGFGPLQPNTIMIGETEKPENYEMFAALLGEVSRRRRNLVIVRDSAHDTAETADSRIDVWWTGEPGNIGLMLTLAHLLRRSHYWEGDQLVIKMIVASEGERAAAEVKLVEFIKEARIGKSVGHEVLVAGENMPFDMICESSRNARLVFLGMRVPGAEESHAQYASYYQQMLEKTERLPVTALVIASGFVNLDALFDDES